MGLATGSTPAQPLLHSSDDDDCSGDETGELHKHCAEAREALRAYGYPSDHKSQICIALDVSVSMDNPNGFYRDGKVQSLIQKAMALAIELSPDETVTIFPFGDRAYGPVVIDEHNIINAIPRVFEAIGNTLKRETNYFSAIQAIRRHYFNDASPHTNASQLYHGTPVYVLFVTDGEPNSNQDLAALQFNACAHTAMFIKFAALQGKQADLDFKALKRICAPTTLRSLPNKHLFILSDPDSLTIEDLFFGHRTWLEEAHEHGVLAADPGVELDETNPNDAAEIAYKEQLEAAHGHLPTGISHGHASPTARASQVQAAMFATPVVVIQAPHPQYGTVPPHHDDEPERDSSCCICM